MKKHHLIFISIALLVFTFGSIAGVCAQESKAKEKMKFLVITEPKDVLYTIPTDERKRIEEENIKYLKNAVQAGQVSKLYSIPGWNRTVSIEQYESIEALYKHFAEDPIYPYRKFQVFPLRVGETQIEGSVKAKPDAKIKVLVISKAKDILYGMPADERRKLEEANSENSSQLEKAGDFLEYYDIPGWNRSVAIEHYRSIEELYKHFDGYPGYPYTSFEVYPLFEIDIMNL